MKVRDLVQEIENVPFGNSVFQIQQFVAHEETPERTYRKVLLQIDQKMKALMECKFRRKRKEIEIKELKEKIKRATGFKKEYLEVDLEEVEHGLNEEIKLINDALIEIKAYEAVLEKLPVFTREEFEQGELSYWQNRLMKMAELEMKSTGAIGVGSLQSLEQIGLIAVRNEQGHMIIFDKDGGQLVKNNEGKFVIEHASSRKIDNHS